MSSPARIVYSAAAQRDANERHVVAGLSGELDRLRGQRDLVTFAERVADHRKPPAARRLGRSRRGRHLLLDADGSRRGAARGPAGTTRSSCLPPVTRDRAPVGPGSRRLEDRDSRARAGPSATSRFPALAFRPAISASRRARLGSGTTSPARSAAGLAPGRARSGRSSSGGRSRSTRVRRPRPATRRRATTRGRPSCRASSATPLIQSRWPRIAGGKPVEIVLGERSTSRRRRRRSSRSFSAAYGAHGLEEPVPGVARAALDVARTSCRRATRRGRGRRRRHGRVADRGGRRPQVEAAGEDREPGEGGLLGLAQQLVVPVEQPLHRALSSGSARIAAAQELEALAQAVEDLGRCEHGEAGRGELDRERHAVEMPADLTDDPLVARSSARSRARATCARSTKSCDGLVVRSAAGRCRQTSSLRERERLPTRRQDARRLGMLARSRSRAAPRRAARARSCRG